MDNTKKKIQKPKEKKGLSKKNPPTPWNGVVLDPEEYEGFVYQITRDDGKYYIGMKFTVSRRRVKVKDSKRRKRIQKDSDWKHYKSSCKELVQDIKQLGMDRFKFDILGWYKTRSGVRYAEMEAQVKRDVLKDPKSYNSNILARWWESNIE